MHDLLVPLVAALTASAFGFLFHVITAESLHSWISVQMKGRTVLRSKSVMIPAAITSIEIGLGLAAIYALIHDNLPFENAILRGLTVGFLILAATGKLFRQPLMNLFVGNPLKVVLIQDGITWVNTLLTSVILALIYEGLR